jgi:polysaccharide deacetylase family protein (PEP-CTERM system associated)
MLNIFSIDLEDWFCSLNDREQNPSLKWRNCEITIEEPTEFLLELLEKYNAKATFFVLGKIAERIPRLIKEIANRGHEIACHGLEHRYINMMSPEEFQMDLEETLEILQGIVPEKIIGFRAPNFSINDNMGYYYEILSSYGFVYDSSVYPFNLHPNYGIRKGNLFPYKEQDIIEVPLSCIDVGGFRLPCSGGGYFRLYPYKAFKKMTEECNLFNRPLVFYTHPWEYNNSESLRNITFFNKLRHSQNRKGLRHKLERLLGDFEFTTFSDYLLRQNLYENCS